MCWGVTCRNGSQSIVSLAHVDELSHFMKMSNLVSLDGAKKALQRGLGFPSTKATGQCQRYKLTCTPPFGRGGFQGSCWVSSTVWILELLSPLASVWKHPWFARLHLGNSVSHNENLDFKVNGSLVVLFVQTLSYWCCLSHPEVLIMESHEWSSSKMEGVGNQSFFRGIFGVCFGLVACTIGLANWLRHGTNRNKIKWTLYGYTWNVGVIYL